MGATSQKTPSAFAFRSCGRCFLVLCTSAFGVCVSLLRSLFSGALHQTHRFDGREGYGNSAHLVGNLRGTPTPAPAHEGTRHAAMVVLAPRAARSEEAGMSFASSGEVQCDNTEE
jgi:hypothetical protein